MSALQTQDQGVVLDSLTLNAVEDFPNQSTRRVAQIVTVEHPSPEDPTPAQRMAIIEASGVLDFWDDPEEDVYNCDDGEAV